MGILAQHAQCAKSGVAGGVRNSGVGETGGTQLAGIAVAAVFLVCVLVLGVIQAALSGIYSAVLYRYAVSHEAPAEFRGLALESAFASK